MAKSQSLPEYGIVFCPCTVFCICSYLVDAISAFCFLICHGLVKACLHDEAHHCVTRGNDTVVRKEALASELQKKFACSTTVAELPGKRRAGSFWFKEELLMILQDILLSTMVSQKDISKCLIKRSGDSQGKKIQILWLDPKNLEGCCNEV
ncbi:hypothetical protein HAX54_032501 [Datura stramonium]|uniref:Uncharacterized protein n=1 Tax=Datura stramonium TaxID=4076 RepID=A0ABS8VDR4_DATST|nr:hypothetical protein [Datura stramonium]